MAEQQGADGARFVAQADPTEGGINDPEAASKQANQPPAAAADCAVTAENTALALAVLQNDRDPNGDPLEVVSTTQPASGAVTIRADDVLTFDAGEPGRHNFRYDVDDGAGGRDSASVTLFVNPSSGELEQSVLTGLGDQELSAIARACAAGSGLDVVSLRGAEVQVAVPKAGQRVQVAAEPGQRIELQGDEFGQATYIVVAGGLLVLTEDGRMVFVEDFVAVAQSDDPATLAVDGGPELDTGTLLANLQPMIAPAAAPEMLGLIEAFAPASGAEHGGGAGFGPFVPGSIGNGPDATGPQPPTALARGGEFLLNDSAVANLASAGVQDDNQRPTVTVTGERSGEVGELTITPEFASGTPFPELIESQAVPTNVINAVDPDNLALGPAADATITFKNEFATFQNALGVYLVRPDGGEITDPRIVFKQVESAEASDDPAFASVQPGGGPLQPGDQVRLSELYTDDELQPGTEFGLFIIVDGFVQDGDLLDNALVFVGGDGGTATVFDRSPPQLFALTPEGPVEFSSNVLHVIDRGSANPLSNALNPDDKGQSLSGLEPANTGLTIGFEDQIFRTGDDDFDDLIVEVTLAPTIEPSLEFVQVEVLTDLTIADPDDTNLSRAVVEIGEGLQPGDVLSLGDLPIDPGITVVEDGSSGRLLLEGIAPIAAYEEALRGVQFDPGQSEGERTISVTVEDEQGAPSLAAPVIVDVGSTNAELGTSGDDVLVGEPNVDDAISGRAGDDQLSGLSGNDLLDGGIGNDILNGGEGDDLLIGGPGVDRLDGGQGADQHVYFALADRGDAIEGFNALQGDVLDFSELLSDEANADNIGDFVDFDSVGADIAVSVDVDGAGQSFAPIAYVTLLDPTGVTSAEDAANNGSLVV